MVEIAKSSLGQSLARIPPPGYPFHSSIFLYGPPGSGKTTAGRLLAADLELPFVDLDEVIAAQAGRTVPEIFAQDGEASFRRAERTALEGTLAGAPAVVALGGGALLDEDTRRQVEGAGPVLCLDVPLETLLTRLQGGPSQSAGVRPLLAGDLAARLEALIKARAAHYTSFQLQLDGAGTPEQVAWQAQVRLGRFFVRGMGAGGYGVRVQAGGLDRLGEAAAALGFHGPAAVVCDEQVGAFYSERACAALRQAGFAPTLVTIPAGEAHKTIQTVGRIWDGFLLAGLERGSLALALGGGVTGDLAGFAAATFLRGIAWSVAPTSLLAMADASLGGKTGADLPQGKNLVGAFHPPRLVLADPDTLATLPETELRSGLAEVVKAGVIGDPALFERCARGWAAVAADWDEVIRRTMAVKIQVIVADPYERGQRAALNLGHTLGHALETLSGFRLRHGEAVAIGMILEARLAERLGLAEPGLAGTIEAALAGLGLPVRIPEGYDLAALDAALRFDKKRAGGKVRFALPARIGEVQVGVAVADWRALLQSS